MTRAQRFALSLLVATLVGCEAASLGGSDAVAQPVSSVYYRYGFVGPNGQSHAGDFSDGGTQIDREVVSQLQPGQTKTVSKEYVEGRARVRETITYYAREAPGGGVQYTKNTQRVISEGGTNLVFSFSNSQTRSA